MTCCPNCFGDRGLRKSIFPSQKSQYGKCNYCLSEDVLVLEAQELGDVFATIANIYEPNEEGQSLIQCLRKDWHLFDHERMDDQRAGDLLAEILGDTAILRGTFAPSPSYYTDRLIHWEKLRDELMFGNRFFPTAELDQDRLANLLTHLILDPDELATDWYRARLLRQDTPYPIQKMGAPTKKLASNGRANPAGIPYLYLGSTEQTAIAEIRPHTGETACVATFTTPQDLKVIDLRDPRRSVSPFVLGDEETIGFMRSDIEFLARLGDELTRPVVPDSAAFDYVPSQYLCEFIKKCGYDGVIYRSSVGEGINMALFDPSRATGGTVMQRLVTRVLVELQES
jgi:hypothetical protein